MLPLTYFTNIARYCIMGTETFSLFTNFAALAVFSVLFTILAIRLHARTVSRQI